MTVRPPGPMDERDASLETSIRLKLDRGEPLTTEERAFLARVPGAKEVPPGRVRG